MIFGVVMKIGIIGFGIVGHAIKHAFDGNADFYISDPKLNEFSNGIDVVYAMSDFIFVCVPTPMTGVEGGKINPTIINSVMEELNDLSKSIQRDVKPVICIKSTVTPDLLKKYEEEYTNLRITMSPEYLTEANYLDDMINMRALVVGGKKEDTSEIVKLFDEHSNCKKPYPIGECDLIASGVLKYMENCFLGLKVTFMNQMYQVLRESGSNDTWENVGKCFHLDKERMGTSHWQVPGPDGDFGYGGKCVTSDAKLSVTIDESEIKNVPINWLYHLVHDKKVQNIKVLSTDSNCLMTNFKKVKSVTCREINENVIGFFTSTGVFKCTTNHLMPIFRDNKKILVQAADVIPSDNLFHVNFGLLNINEIRSLIYFGKVYNLELESLSDDSKDDLFWVESETGIVTHNCLPKDINAMISYANSIGVNFDLMEKTWEINKRIRTDIDWAKIEGAVLDEE